MKIDINTTSICNISCTYCSEGSDCNLSSLFMTKTHVSLEELFELIDKIDVRDEDFQLMFWGGEPLVNWDYCKKIIEKYIDNERFIFCFYTNGTLIYKHIGEIIELSKKLSKERFYFLVSYDGEPVNSLARVDRNNKPTTYATLNGIRFLKRNKVNYGTKATIEPKNFKYMFEAFLDCISRGFEYKVTVDTQSGDNHKYEYYSQFFPDLKASLAKIMKYIYDNKLPLETFEWFRPVRQTCNAGEDYFGIDVNGDIGTCHGCMYKCSDEHKITDVKSMLANPEPIKVLDDMKLKFSPLNDQLAPNGSECDTCTVVHCMSCATINYNKSDKESYEDRWRDRKSNPMLCETYKISDEYYRALLYAVKKRGY